MTLASVIGGVCGLHRLGRVAPLFAALTALPFAWGLHYLGGFPFFALACGIALLKAIWALPRSDVPPVLDRLVGQLLALTPLSAGLWFAGVPPHVFPWPGWVGAFILFNGLLLLNPIRSLSRFGPLKDDIAAASLTALLILVSAGISHGWFA